MTTSHDPDTTPSPEPPAESSPLSPERRTFLGWLSVCLGGLGALAAGIPFLGFLFSPLWREEPEVWRAVGPLEDFPIGSTQKVNLLDPAPLPWAGFAGLSAAWLRREGETSFVAFSIHCTHTGCPIEWHQGAELFLCPCHGGAFYRNGAVAAGPPPAPLERHPVRLRDGQVEVRTIGLPTPS